MTSTYATDPGSHGLGESCTSGGGWTDQVNVGRTERWISAAAGVALLGLRARPPALSRRAPAGRHRVAAPRDHRPLRDQPRAGPEFGAGRGAGQPGREPGAGRGTEDRAGGDDSPAPRRAVPLLAPVRQPAALHGQSRVGHRPGQPALPLGREGTRWAPASNGTPRSTMRSRTSSSPGAPCRAPMSIRLGRSTSRPPRTGSTEVRVVMRYAAPGRQGG